MREMQVFTNPEFGQVRTVEIDGEAWLVGRDVAAALGYGDGNQNSKALSNAIADHVDDEDKKMLPYSTFKEYQNGDLKNISHYGATVINESGLYALVFGSRLPNAKQFKRWVTHDVLPSIRRTGGYQMPQAQMTPAQLLAAQAQVLVDMEQRMNEMQDRTASLETKVNTALEAFARPAQDHWKEDMDTAIKTMCTEQHLSVTAEKGRLYAELERAAACNVDARLARLRERKKKAGMRHHDAMALTKLDAIAEDRQLRAIFEGIVRKMQAQAAQKCTTQK